MTIVEQCGPILLRQLPEKVQKHLKEYEGSLYGLNACAVESERTKIRSNIYVYTTALCDAGLINDRERDMLYWYVIGKWRTSSEME